jgi:hypothetical protein
LTQSRFNILVPAAIFLVCLSSSLQAEDIILVPESSAKRVLIPQSDIGNDWRTDAGYDDSAWLICEGAPGGIGYELTSGYDSWITLDVESLMHESGGNPVPCCYLRIRFTIDEEDINQLEFLKLRMLHGLNVSNSSSDFLILPELTGSDSQFGGFISTRLPLIIIDTDGRTIPDEPKIEAEMKIINKDSGQVNTPLDAPTDYYGKIGIEIRGTYSATFPQKPYGIETRDGLGENNNVPLLGMPAENDWALITNYNEKSLVRTTLAFDLFREMGHYAPRARLCEVLVNSEYQGIYVFTEKIKRDKNRVDISRLNPDENTGDDVTGGYIIKIDYYDGNNSWLSKHHPIGHPYKDVYFVHYYPEPDIITQEQRDYIHGFFDDLENALYANDFDDPSTGYRAYIDVPSFIDYFIISEVSRNVDGYKKSRYWFKDKDSMGGLLKAGPVWDFDWAWKNIRECFFANTDGSGWGYKTNDCDNWPITPGWYVRLLQDAFFTNKLIDRYSELRTGVLDLDKINSYIDSVRFLVDEAQERHFELWPIESDYRAPEVDPPSLTYDQEITKLKEWIRIRIAWLDEHIPLLQNEISRNKEQAVSMTVFPNPSPGRITVNANESIRQILVINTVGQVVYQSQVETGRSINILLSGLPSGLYYVKALFDDQRFEIQKLMICR